MRVGALAEQNNIEGVVGWLSVTRFGEISPLWLNFHNFGELFLKAYLVFDNIFSQIWPNI